MIKLIAIKYPTVIDIDAQKTAKNVKYSTTLQHVQELIKTLLFIDRYNHVLVSLDNKLYVCEPIDFDNRKYSRRIVEYHPLAGELTTA